MSLSLSDLSPSLWLSCGTDASLGCDTDPRTHSAVVCRRNLPPLLCLRRRVLSLSHSLWGYDWCACVCTRAPVTESTESTVEGGGTAAADVLRERDEVRLLKTSPAYHAHSRSLPRDLSSGSDGARETDDAGRLRRPDLQISHPSLPSLSLSLCFLS